MSRPQGDLRFTEEVYVVNLFRRADRLEKFWASYPRSLGECLRFPAIDGKRSPPPRWWKAPAGAWGCYRSHLALVESCLNRGVESVLILEDDAEPVKDFDDRLEALLVDLPDDWTCLYLGGQIWNAAGARPKPVVDHDQVLEPHNVNRTHAYALRKQGLVDAYQHLCAIDDWSRGHHIDHHLGKWHETHPGGIYVPIRWLFGQGGGPSDVATQNKRAEMWRDPAVEAGIIDRIVELKRRNPPPRRVGIILNSLVIGDPTRERLARDRLTRWAASERKAGRDASLPDTPKTRALFPDANVLPNA